MSLYGLLGLCIVCRGFVGPQGGLGKWEAAEGPGEGGSEEQTVDIGITIANREYQ